MTSSLRDYQALADIEKEWAELVRDIGMGSPFAHPAWSLSWARHFVPESDLEFVAVREAGDGRLVGLAPFYRRRRTVGGFGVCIIQPIGAGQGDPVTEVLHFAADPACCREVLAAVVRHLAALPGVDWLQFCVGDGQPWLLPQWLPDDFIAIHRKTRPCVLLDALPEEPDSLLPSLGRNLRESLRRARNRSAKLGDMTFRVASEPAEFDLALRHLIRLHAMRSQMAGKVSHPDLLGGSFGDLLCEAASALAREGLATVQLAEHAGDAVAAQLVLSDGSADYISVSGLDPKFWELNLNTMLIFRAAQQAIADGRRSVNLSSGPNIAKMRWSSKVVCSHDFDVVSTKRRSRLAHAGYTHVALAKENQQVRRRQRILEDTTTGKWEFLRRKFFGDESATNGSE